MALSPLDDLRRRFRSASTRRALDELRHDVTRLIRQTAEDGTEDDGSMSEGSQALFDALKQLLTEIDSKVSRQSVLDDLDTRPARRDRADRGFDGSLYEFLIRGMPAVPNPLSIGAWSDMIICYWSELDILPNATADSVYSTGAVMVRALLTADVNLRHPQSFAWANMQTGPSIPALGGAAALGGTANDTLAEVRAGLLAGMSIGFYVRGEAWNGAHDQRTLQDIELVEISAVGPSVAYSGTSIAARSLSHRTTKSAARARLLRGLEAL